MIFGFLIPYVVFASMIDKCTSLIVDTKRTNVICNDITTYTRNTVHIIQKNWLKSYVSELLDVAFVDLVLPVFFEDTVFA